MSTRPFRPVSAFLREKDDVAESSSYFVANRTLVADTAIPELEPFRQGGGELQGRPEVGRVSTSGKEVFSGRGWVGGRWVEVRCHRLPEFYAVDVEHSGRFLIAADGRSIVGVGSRDRGGREGRLALLGPCLSLALAASGTFCLHASAVIRGDLAIALMGDTGMGKSTLVEYAARGSPRWRRVADDVLPLAPVSGQPTGLPHFPQLKLPAGEQWRLTDPAELPLRRIYWLRRSAPGAAIEIQPLSMKNSTLAVVRHTVAGRLFDPSLRERQLEWAARVAEAREVREVIFPDDPGQVGQVLSAIRNDLG